MSHSKTWIGIVGTLVIVGTLYAWLCRGYGEVSDHGYQYAIALYSCCNLKDSERLDKISQMLQDDTAREELSAAESSWLTQIVDQAQAGDWTAASQEVRALMNAQIKRSS